jgi:hypothetical protein
MAYTQGKNPISRKNSPLNANNPFKRVSPLNEVMLDPEDDAPISPQNAEMLAQMDTTQGGTMPQDTSIEPGDKDYEAISRKSSPLNEHDEWQKKINAARAEWEAEEKEGDFYEAHADLFKGQEEARKAHKEEKPKEKDEAISRRASKKERTAAAKGAAQAALERYGK